MYLRHVNCGKKILNVMVKNCDEDMEYQIKSFQYWSVIAVRKYILQQPFDQISQYCLLFSIFILV